MMLETLPGLLRVLVERRAVLIAENLALRQQLAVLRRSVKRLRLRPRDRIFRALMSRLWNDRRSALIIVKPATIVRWHRKGFKIYRRWKNRWDRGRPAVAREIRDLIRGMCKANPLWGAPRIIGELLKVCIDVSQSTVAKYMVRIRKPRSPTWRAFLMDTGPKGPGHRRTASGSGPVVTAQALRGARPTVGSSSQ